MGKYLMLLLILGVSMVSGGQDPKIIDLDAKPIKTEQQQIGKAQPTIHRAIYKKQEYIIYKNVNKQGKVSHFIVYKNKNGGYNKKYITEEQFGNIL